MRKQGYHSRDKETKPQIKSNTTARILQGNMSYFHNRTHLFRVTLGYINPTWALKQSHKQADKSPGKFHPRADSTGTQLKQTYTFD